MGDFATTWSRGRRESGNSAEEWASDLRTISTIFCCLAVEGHKGGTDEGDQRDAELYNDIFKRIQLTVYSYDGTIRQFLVDDKGRLASKGKIEAKRPQLIFDLNTASSGMVLIANFGIRMHEDDAERATRCSMALRDELNRIQVGSSCGVTTGKASEAVLPSTVKGDLI